MCEALTKRRQLVETKLNQIGRLEVDIAYYKEQLRREIENLQGETYPKNLGSSSPVSKHRVPGDPVPKAAKCIRKYTRYIEEVEGRLAAAEEEKRELVQLLEDVRDRVSAKALEYGRRRYVQGEAVKEIALDWGVQPESTCRYRHEVLDAVGEVLELD